MDFPLASAINTMSESDLKERLAAALQIPQDNCGFRR
jgi:hypothetical protein